MKHEFTIGGLAQAAGVGVETVRFYQRKGLIAEPPRPAGGVRRYVDADATRIRFIRAAAGLGFSLADVAELLRLEDGGSCAEVRHVAEHKLRAVEERLAALQRMQGTLRVLVRRCRATRGRVQCPIIATLATAAAGGAPRPDQP